MDITTNSQYAKQFEDKRAKSLVLRNSSTKDRRIKLKRLENWILSNRSDIQAAVYKDLKKPEQETDITEIYVVLSEIRLARKKLKFWNSKRYVGTSLPFLGTSAYVYHEPKGTCLIIAPWNYPFQLASAPLVSAIAAGNSVIVKPSDYTKNTANLLKRMCEEVFDQDEVSVELGGIQESTELLKLPFDHIFFTGSPAVGKIVMAAAAKNLTSITLELGGKSPTIINKDADIEDAATKIAWGKWQNAGQVCIAPDYLLVHEGVKEKLITELAKQASEIYGNKENYSSIVSGNHHERMTNLMVDAIKHGAQIEFGGESNKEELTFNPTLLSHISAQSQIMQEEIFGPILILFTFSGLEEVISFINDRPKPLALYLFARSKKTIEFIQANTSSGMMAINETVLQFANPHLPIGGVNNSGIGKSHGHAGFIAFTNEKAVLKQRRGLTVAKLVYPPYSKIKNLIINFLIKFG